MRIRSTTIVAVKRGNTMALAGDGQASLGQTIVKTKARKVRRMSGGKVLGGFAGSAADGIALFERLEGKLSEHGGILRRAAVELAKDWRTDRVLRKLEAMIIVADKSDIFLLSGGGDVIEPDDGLVAIGSGGNFALASARALMTHTEMGAAEIARESLKIAADICVYTNHSVVVEELKA
jgi:ATP-dependent HslUV protease subunit HslV